jgi:putative Mg2+ transporter-C (MgtC) family protein
MGIERSFYNKAASIRTFTLICLGSCVFTTLSFSLMTAMSDPARISAQIVSGIGFIGGGVILKNENRIEGITTASMMWFASAIGMICGFGYYLFAISTFILYVIMLVLGIVIHNMVDKILGTQNEANKQSD